MPPDHLGWRVSTNASGQVVGQQGHYPYGESEYSQNGNEFVFTSYSRDMATGLDYAMARWYDSGAGRFCSADPVGGSPGDPQSWNRYPYSRNDPIDITDPSGQKGFWSWLSNVFRYLLAFLTGGAVNPYGTKMGTPPFSPVGEQPPFMKGIPGSGVIDESDGFGGARAFLSSAESDGTQDVGTLLSWIAPGLTYLKNWKPHSKPCRHDLKQLGLTAAKVNGLAGSTQFKNAWSSPAVIQNWDTLTGNTNADFAVFPKTDPHTVFYNSERMSWESSFSDILGAETHELAHINDPSKTDEDLESALGVGEPSNNISKQLAKHCFKWVKAP